MNVLMNRRVTLAAWVVGFACVFYGAYSFLIFHQIDLLISRFGPIDPRAPLDDEVKKFLPLFEMSVIGSLLPLGLCAHAIRSALRRRYRGKHDLCVECGRPITDWHGRCPGCGVRIGPDPPRVHTLRTSCR
jgi:hypothetical protein